MERCEPLIFFNAFGCRRACVTSLLRCCGFYAACLLMRRTYLATGACHVVGCHPRQYLSLYLPEFGCASTCWHDFPEKAYDNSAKCYSEYTKNRHQHNESVVFSSSRFFHDRGLIMSLKWAPAKSNGQPAQHREPLHWCM